MATCQNPWFERYRPGTYARGGLRGRVSLSRGSARGGLRGPMRGQARHPQGFPGQFLESLGMRGVCADLCAGKAAKFTPWGCFGALLDLKKVFAEVCAVYIYIGFVLGSSRGSAPYIYSFL